MINQLRLTNLFGFDHLSRFEHEMYFKSWLTPQYGIQRFAVETPARRAPVYKRKGPQQALMVNLALYDSQKLVKVSITRYPQSSGA